MATDPHDGRWNPDHYLLYSEERTRPSRDLVARIALDAPASIVDIGCGPGNSTQVLRERWPDARIVGMDSSPEMIDKACAGCPEGEYAIWLGVTYLNIDRRTSPALVEIASSAERAAAATPVPQRAAGQLSPWGSGRPRGRRDTVVVSRRLSGRQRAGVASSPW